MSSDLSYGVFIANTSSQVELDERFPKWRELIEAEDLSARLDRVCFWEVGEPSELASVAQWVDERGVELVFSTLPWDEFSFGDLREYPDFFRKLRYYEEGRPVQTNGKLVSPKYDLLVVYDSEESDPDGYVAELAKRSHMFALAGVLKIQVFDLANELAPLPSCRVCVSLLRSDRTERWCSVNTDISMPNGFFRVFNRDGGLRRLHWNGTMSSRNLDTTFPTGKIRRFRDLCSFYTGLLEIPEGSFESGESRLDEELIGFDWSQMFEGIWKVWDRCDKEPDFGYIKTVSVSLDVSNRMASRFSMLAFFALILSESNPSVFGDESSKRDAILSEVKEWLVALLLESSYSRGWSFLFLKMRNLYPDFIEYYSESVLEVYDTNKGRKGLFSCASLALLDQIRSGFPASDSALLNTALELYRKDESAGRIDKTLYSRISGLKFLELGADGFIEFVGSRKLKEISVIEAHFLAAELCLVVRRFDEALSLLLNIRGKLDKSRYAVRILIEAQLNTGQIESAAKDFDDFLGRGVLHAADVLLFGVSMLDRNPRGTLCDKVSEEELEQVLKILERYDSVNFLVGRLRIVYLLASGRVEEARAYFDSWRERPNVDLAELDRLAVHAFRAGVEKTLADWPYPNETRNPATIEMTIRSFLSCTIRGDLKGLEQICQWILRSEEFRELEEQHLVGDPSVCRNLILELLACTPDGWGERVSKLGSLMLLHWDARWRMDSSVRLSFECLNTPLIRDALNKLSQSVLRLLEARNVAGPDL